MNICLNQSPFSRFEEADLDSDHLGLNLVGGRQLPSIDIEYTGAERTERHTLFAYIHGSVEVSTHRKCDWDSAECGHIDVPAGERLEYLLKCLNAYLNNDSYYGEAEDGTVICGTQSECIAQAEELGYTYTFEY